MKKAETADFPAFEAEMLKMWEKEKTFDQSLNDRKGRPRFSFYDGPPFANGRPHYGHVLAATIKDSITRYKTMRGYYVPRRLGWDTHGLPVEYEVEKELKISGKRQILELGVDVFNRTARDSVFRYRDVFEDLYRRIGRWADQEHSYATMDNDYIESVWWVLSRLHTEGLVYRGFRSNPYCPRCATPLSNFEVNQNYKDNVSDPSVYAKFEVLGEPRTSLLAWTTTPWTLPANSALAVAGEATYVTIEFTKDGDSWEKGERLILAKARTAELDLRKAEYKAIKTQKGDELVGIAYKPLYDGPLPGNTKNDKAWHVYADASVSLEDGTGILHVVPRYGETDLDLGLREGLPLIESVNSFGRMVGEFGQIDGLREIVDLFFKEADPYIIEDLTKKGKLFAAESFEHTYPFCWRCETPLLYYAMPSWFIRVSSMRHKLVSNNEQIHWVPDHIKQGRFGNWLAEARDWNFSRNRFWGAPLPIWINENDESDILVVGSLKELRELSGLTGDFDLHRPGIDQIVLKKDGKLYRRTEEVFDCWFESGSMPYAQDHYPFTDKDQFEDAFPSEFIAEGVDQTRGWFYTLHVLASALFDKPAFKNVIVNGMVLAADGKKLSKRLKNYPEPAEIFDSTGADSLRYFLMSSPVVNGEDVRFSFDGVNEVKRNVFMTLWNTYSFLSMYAEIDEWEPESTLAEPHSQHLLDQWLMSRLNETIGEMTKQVDNYEIARAVRPLRELMDDLSNWYVRRSRRRFWKSDQTDDKNAAYATLHYALARICQLMAPWSPFLPDKLWRGLTAGMKEQSSVHLTDWPTAGQVDRTLLMQMAQTTRSLIALALAQRAEAGVKVRQPLSNLEVTAPQALPPDLVTLIADEVNVKSVNVTKGDLAITLDFTVTSELKAEGIMRDVVRHVQNVRKEVGLEVSDRIVLTLLTDSESLARAIDVHAATIKTETLAEKLQTSGARDSVPVRVDGSELYIGVSKA